MSSNGNEPSIPNLVAQWNDIVSRSRTGESATTAADAEVRTSLPASGGRRSLAPESPLESPMKSPPVPDALECLKQMLRVAVQLEFATIPPYLCALWSIEDDLHRVAKSIREVVQEEMLHLALTCNLLAAMGETPDLCKWAPSYPGPLPGGVHSDLQVYLRGLDPVSLAAFVRIESPESLPDNVVVEPGDPVWKGGGTIGQLYEAILAAFRRLKPKLKVDCQVTGPLSWRTLATLADVEWAIRLIQKQGEGAVIEPLDSGKDDLAHYYRFLEVLKEKRLAYDPAQKMFVWQRGYSRPKVRPMGPVPEGGYPPSPDPQVEHLLNQFDKTYTNMLCFLNRTWKPGGQGSFIKAIDLMFELERYAKPLMAIPLPSDPKQTYGPRFRCLQASDKSEG